MKRSKTVKMLTGVSLIALAVIANPPKRAFATDVLSPGAYVTISLPSDNPTNLTGNVIGPGDASATNGITYGVGIVDGVEVDGFLWNQGEIYASLEDDAGAGDVFGVYIEDGVTFDAGGVRNDNAVYASAIDAIFPAGANDFSYAEAIGIEFNAVDAVNDAAANVLNRAGGHIGASALAVTYSTADAFAAGVRELVSSADEGTAYLQNHGRITADAVAGVILADGFGSAYATATGVFQSVLAGEDGYAEVENDGLIDATSFAYAEADSAVLNIYAEANAAGVTQIVDAGEFGSALVHNELDLEELSKISAIATAIAYGSAYGSANANAFGVEQMVVDGDLAVAITQNFGLIEAGAIAYVSAEDALADASSFGVLQGVDGFKQAGAGVYNVGVIDVQAGALAYGTTAVAHVTAAGIYQTGEIDSFEGEIVLEVENSGIISTDALAVALGSNVAVAAASAAGIYQSGQGLGDITLSVENHAAILSFAVANAVSVAVADANARSYGVAQTATGKDFESESLALIANDTDAVIAAYASAEASSILGSAYASAAAAGVFQTINSDEPYLGNATAEVMNHGTIYADAVAAAYGNFAKAEATAAGIFQFASADSDEDGFGIADLYVDNDALILVETSASAEGYTAAIAYSSAEGVIQRAYSNAGAESNSLDAYAELLNSGSIAVMVAADAYSTDGVALSVVNVHGANQIAEATNSAELSAENTGDIVGFANSDAAGKDWAGAFGRAVGIEQLAGAGSMASATLVNDDTILSIADVAAYATGPLGEASAIASAMGVEQLSSSDAQADSYAENNGTIWVTSISDAEAYDAFASGTGTGLLQQAESGGVAGAVAVNNGFPDVYESSVDAAEWALADLGAWLFTAGGTGGVDLASAAVADVSPPVLGGLYVISAAMADGVYASAEDLAFGISQESDGSDSYVEVTNNGYIGVISAGVAGMSGSALSADAEVQGVGIEQNSYASGVATADIANLGSNNLLGLAIANGVYAEAGVLAFGSVQNVAGAGGSASADLVNDGSTFILSAGLAISDGGVDSYGSAEALGVGGLQQASALAADVSAANSGTLSANAIALAMNGDAAFAESSGAGLIQLAAGQFADAYAINTGYPEGDFGLDVMGSMGPAADEGDLPGEGLISLLDGIYVVSLAAAGAYTSASAVAEGIGIGQDVRGGIASAEAYNEGYIGVATVAIANASEGDAGAGLSATGVGQDLYAAYSYGITSGVASFDNGYDEQLNVGGIAFANGYGNAAATGNVTAVDQYSENFRSATVEAYNDGDIRAVGIASAASDYGHAGARMTSKGIFQDIEVYEDGEGYALVENDGFIVGMGRASADGYHDSFALVFANGIDQNVDDQSDAASVPSEVDALVINGVGGEIYASAEAVANASYDTANATASAGVQGISQMLYGGAAEAGVINEGSVLAIADVDAYASGILGSAGAFAYATGVFQVAMGDGIISSVNLYNSGRIDAFALAEADAYDDQAQALVFGHRAIGSEYLDVYVENTVGGVIMSVAVADAYDAAGAEAVGAMFEADLYLDGTITNDGIIAGSARAYGNGVAYAHGVIESSGSGNTVDLINTGEIIAFAVGEYAMATAVAISGQTVGFATILPEEATATVTNSGGAILAAVADGYDEDEIYHRGNAINTAGFFSPLLDGSYLGQAPNSVDIYLEGGAGVAGYKYAFTNDYASQVVQDWFESETTVGYVYGNVDITDDDSIIVRDGVTIFDGIVNASVPTPVSYDGDSYGEGSLSILDGGTLAMLRNNVDGPSGASVENFTVESGGTLAIELTDEYGEGDYSQVFTKNASIQGDVAAIYRPGMYQNEYHYNNVIDIYDTVTSTVVSGTGFAHVYDNSALLETQSDVDDEGSVDLHVRRVKFNEVPGSTHNQSAAGSGIERVYDGGAGIDPDTDFGRLVSQLFTLDEAEYANAMDQLGGAEYAQHLQSVLWSTRSMQRTITERMECADEGTSNDKLASAGKAAGARVMPTADTQMNATGCFDPGRGSLWVRGFGQVNTLQGGDNTPEMNESQAGVTFGGDYSFDENWFIGLAGGYFNSTGNFDDWGGRDGASIDYSGWQFAAYGGFDNSDYYLRGIMTYGGYEGSANRSFTMNEHWDDTEHAAYHGSYSPVSGSLSGDPTSSVLSFYGETGYRMDVSNSATVTPYAGLNVASATLDNFTESDAGGTGAALAVNGSDAESLVSVLGLRFNGEFAMGESLFSPTMSIAWAHEFADTAEVDMSYAGDGAPDGADFTIKGTDVAADSILIDIGANFSMSETFDVGLYYNGMYNMDYMSNAVTARLQYKF
ncbi:autotransporter domain-containing protein [Aestuariivirga sp.]|jgi:hypothetical protein|uniref:autotransporter domain-containing protein n=1 Tax=Aestuariivirga sp. TaxID=2650926 RepID=UPI003784E9A3